MKQLSLVDKKESERERESKTCRKMLWPTLLHFSRVVGHFLVSSSGQIKRNWKIFRTKKQTNKSNKVEFKAFNKTDGRNFLNELQETKIHTVSFTDLDRSSEMIIFESLLTTFEASFIF
jgi:hypothetical protein